MKKIKYLGLFLFLSCLTIGFVNPQDIIYKSNSTVRKYYPDKSVTNSWLYINGFSSILGNPTNEASLKTYLTSKGVNSPIFYLSSLLDDAEKRASMRAYNLSLNTAGITKRQANVTQSEDAITTGDLGTPAGFNTTCSVAGEKFNAFSNEIEWWKENPYFDSFEDFTEDNILIYNFCLANGIENNAYIARFRDYAGETAPEDVADWCVEHYEVINLVCYVTTAKFEQYSGLSDGIKAQLELMGKAAIRAGKKQKFNILFASEGNDGANMNNWYSSHPKLLDSYNKFTTAYNNWNSTAKAGLVKSGQNIYAQTGLRD